MKENEGLFDRKIGLRGVFTLLVLHQGGPNHVWGIAKLLNNRFDMHSSLASWYDLLHGFEERGLVTKSSAPSLAGPPRIIYSLTETGQALAAQAETFILSLHHYLVSEPGTEEE